MANEFVDDYKRKIKFLENKLTDLSKEKNSELNLFELLKTSTDVFYSRNLKNNKYDYISESMFDILGYTSSEFMDFHIEFVFGLIHPEDKDKIKKFFTDFLSYSSEKEKKFNIEYRIKHKNGHYVWVSENISMIRDDKSKPSHMVGNLRDVSIKKLNDEKILNNESLLLAIIENTSGILWSIDKNYRLIQSNSIFKKNTSQVFKKEYKIGINVLSDVKGKDYNEWKAYYDKALNGEQFKFEKKRKFKNKKNWNEYHFSPIISKDKKVIGATIISYDITKRKLAEEALIESEQRFKKYTQNSPVGIYTTDLNGDCTYANQKWLNMAGMKMDEALGKGWINALHPEDKISISENWNKAVKSKGKWAYEYRFVNKKGEITWVYGMTVELLDNEKRISGYLGTNININQIKEAEQKLQQNKLQLEELNVTKDKLFSIIAHDLKNPFNSIIGFSELLVDHIKSKQYSKIEKFSGIILQESKNTMNLLSNLLEWSRLQTETLLFEPEVFDFYNLVQEIIDLYEITAAQKNISISYYEDSKITMFADRNMIHTVLRNLITNAIKFTNSKGKISIQTQKNNKYIIVTIQDNGVGINQENIQKLFKLSDTYSTKGTNEEKGTGLGLILCKDFIEKHQGKIWVESTVGKGSSFHFSIPIKIS